jgi:hypothetical protein
MAGSFRGFEVGCGGIVRRNINWVSSFALANGFGPFLPLINMSASINEQVKLSINDIKLLQCIKTP